MPHFKDKILLPVLFTSAVAMADTSNDKSEVKLNEIEVSAQDESKTPIIGTTIKSDKELTKQQASDVRDITRYDTGVTIVEKGRMGASGFSIRGVDENRVAIEVDGVAQAETLSSQGFKDLFEGYGNFNNTRNSTEIETLSSVRINKGADSISTGSGALGGSVIYKTKDARDFLTEKDWYLGYKRGYNTADNHNMQSFSAAFRLGLFDFLAVRTLRHSHEIENYGYKNYADIQQGRERDKSDPYTREQDSSLLKFSFNPTEDHRISFISDKQSAKNSGLDMSYTLQPQIQGLPTAPEVDLRHTNDSVKRRNYQVVYESYYQTPFSDYINITYSDQKIRSRARTDDYCDSGSACEGVKNDEGYHIQDNKLVDKNGNEANLNSPNIGTARPDQRWFDCSIYDCNSPIKGYAQANFSSPVVKKDFILDQTYTDPNTGKIYKKVSSAHYLDRVLLPNSKGYNGNIWKERDLNTQTKQIRLDLEKYLEISKTQHDITYGAALIKTEKSMVNKTGYGATNLQWWADLLPLNPGVDDPCQTLASNGICLNRVESEDSFLIPVQATDKAIYLADNFKFNDYIALNFGYRYDKIKYEPKYIPGKTPKIPDDMVKGLFIPQGAEPKWWNYPGGANDPQYLKDKENYDRNAEYNINYIAQKRDYSSDSYVFGGDFDPFKFLKIQLKHSKGFRAPTSDEVYFTFKHPDFSVLPNPNLKHETARTNEISFTLHDDNYGYFTISRFKTDYKNFIDLAYQGAKQFLIGGTAQDYQLYQNINRINAEVIGTEIESKFKFDELHPYLKGFNLSYKFTKQKGRMQDKKIPMNAIQPATSVYGLEYSLKKFGLNIYYTKVAKKEAKDTYDMYESGVKPIKYRSDDYSVIDVLASLEPIKNLVLRFGAYNLTDKKYMTWEQARSIRKFGTSNLINQATGAGINRFYSPGRNYRLSFEYSF